MQSIRVDNELELRMLALEHAAELFALTDANRVYLRQWLPWLDSVRVAADTERFIAKSILAYQETKAFVAGICWREKLVGVIGHNRVDWENRIAHLGYWLASDAQNRGIMTRSVRALVQHAFDVLNLNRIEICTAVGNYRSEAIPIRLGFVHEGIRRQGEWLYDRFLDLNVFAMLRYRWSASPP
ncbi:MAG TPA: GNAT family protein [Steroidobacteraceae bacterium]|nr:GNAT family protein [Steroidobacteraceae bacterium]